jgi:long-subunit fatty acid transport protein
MHDTSGVFVAPNIEASTDLGGRLKHWVIGAGIYGPPSIGNHQYGVGQPVTVDSSPNSPPAPTRYDIQKTNLLIFFPTLAVAYQPDPAVEFGLAWQMYYATFDLSNANLTPLGKSLCPTPDYANCDSYGRVQATGNSFGSSSQTFNGTPYAYSPGLSSFGWVLSLMLHPSEHFDLGATLRPQIDVHSEGTLHPTSPPAQPQLTPDPAATFSTILPTIFRTGARAIMRYPDGSERADLEFDFQYENWAAERTDHIHATGDALIFSKGNTVDVDVAHYYHDTFGFRLGGAYNYRVGERMLAIGRLGLFYDSSSSDSTLTSLDFDTLAKWGFTAGLGFKWRGVLVNAAYAFIYSAPRTVTDSQVYAVSATNGTNYAPSDPRIAVGNGKYEASLQIFSLGVTINFSDLSRTVATPK